MQRVGLLAATALSILAAPLLAGSWTTGHPAGGAASAAVLDTPPPPADRVDLGPPQDPLAGPQASIADAGTPRGNPLWAIPMASLDATRERPLFSPSRRPAEPAQVAVATPPEPPPQQQVGTPAAPRFQLTLVGTVVGGNDGYGIFLDPATNSVVRLKTGESHGGWVLQSVGIRQAELANGGATELLTLPDHNADAIATPTRPAPGR